MYEWKVITTFVTDSEEFNISLKEIERRTDIAQPNISKSLKGLVYQGILIKEDSKKYVLNDELLSKNYVPSKTSSSDTRRQDDSAEPKNSGNFAKQSEIKKEKSKKADENIKRMYKEKALKSKQFYTWTLFDSEYVGSKIFVKFEEDEDKITVLISDSADGEKRTRIAPMELVEEICRKKLNLSEPDDIIKYMNYRYQDEFSRKYKLK